MLEVTVVRPDGDGTKLWRLRLDEGATAGTALRAAGMAAEAIDLFSNKMVGVFSNVVSEDFCLRNGDRLEIYRPLRLEAREARRQRALAVRKQRSLDR